MFPSVSFYPIVLLLLIFLLLLVSEATISNGFKQFISNRFGKEIAEVLARSDLGDGGSFGGGETVAALATSRQPVILVHGITNTAGTFADIRQHFLNSGYGNNEIYSTTYGDGGRTTVFFVTMQCDYVRQVRRLIEAVSAYTQSKVDIIGYSMGSPIARKAILGGRCTDTGEELGPSLTASVDTYLGVAGADHGSFWCVLPFGSCNIHNGLHCHSRFLNDVNSRQRYEGAHIFSLYSRNDDKVGFHVCGKVTSSIAGENRGIEKSGLNHDQLMKNTAGEQLRIVAEQRI